MKQALVIGLGISGKASCKLLQSQGYQVTGSDAKPVSVEGIEIVSDRCDLSHFDLVVPSPGIPWDHPHYKKALELGLPIYGEAQLALSALSSPRAQSMVAITGTNGKTTVTALLTHVLQCSGRKAKALGNIGDPLALYALHSDPEEILVIELSSYQLETMAGNFFDAAAILNITPDHLDRYPSMQAYARTKWRLQHCLRTEKPLFVYQKVMEEFGDLRAIDTIVSYKKMATHDEENWEATWLLAHTLGVAKEEFSSALATFQKPLHRMQYLGSIKGVRYYDDSKGTNVDAVIRAVEGMQGAVWLIAGGIDKGASYSLWRQAFEGKVKKIFAIGQAKEKIAEEAGEFCSVEKVASLEEAVKRAAKQAEMSDNVLLSPGCASFDLFDDYAHRGREFQKFVNQLEGES